MTQYAKDSRTSRELVATACRVLAMKGLVDGILGHVSLRVSETELLVRCRGEGEKGLAHTLASDIWRVDLDGRAIDLPEGYKAPNELPIHTELMRRDASVTSVVHAHPVSALLAGLAGLSPKAVFGAFNIPAMRLAARGIPIYPRSVLIARRELAQEMAAAMGESSVCLLLGHGITVSASSVEGATTTAIDFDALMRITVDLARIGAFPESLSDADLAELPDLGQGFNERFVWQSLVADLAMLEAGRGLRTTERWTRPSSERKEDHR